MHGTNTEWGGWADNLSMIMYIILVGIDKNKLKLICSATRAFFLWLPIMVASNAKMSSANRALCYTYRHPPKGWKKIPYKVSWRLKLF